jgi:hypothetical protein
MLVSADVKTIHSSLKKRIHFLLRRTNGLMKSANSIVQHFNPACRSARAFPDYSIPRLLMTLNDSDIPRRRPGEVHLLLEKMFNAYNAVVYDKPDPTDGVKIRWSFVVFETISYPLFLLHELFIYLVPMRSYEIAVNLITLVVFHASVLLLCLYCGDAGVIGGSVLLGIPGLSLLSYFLGDTGLQLYKLYRNRQQSSAETEFSEAALDKEVELKPTSIIKSRPWASPFDLGFLGKSASVQPVDDGTVLELEDFNDDQSVITYSTISKHSIIPALDLREIPTVKQGRQLAALRDDEDGWSTGESSIGSYRGDKKKKKHKSQKNKNRVNINDIISNVSLVEFRRGSNASESINTIISNISDFTFTSQAFNSRSDSSQAKFVKKDIPTDLSVSLMPLADDAVSPVFKSPRRRKHHQHVLGPGAKSIQQFAPLEKNLHPGRYLMQLINIKPEAELPPLDALGQYLAFYSSGLFRDCAVKYCLGQEEHAEYHAAHGDHDHHRPESDASVACSGSSTATSKTKHPLWF